MQPVTWMTLNFRQEIRSLSRSSLPDKNKKILIKTLLISVSHYNYAKKNSLKDAVRQDDITLQ